MTSPTETLRQKASRLMNEYEALGPRPGGESAYAGAEAHDMSVHATWPREMLEGIEAKAAAAGDHG